MSDLYLELLIHTEILLPSSGKFVDFVAQVTKRLRLLYSENGGDCFAPFQRPAQASAVQLRLIPRAAAPLAPAAGVYRGQALAAAIPGVFATGRASTFARRPPGTAAPATPAVIATNVCRYVRLPAARAASE